MDGNNGKFFITRFYTFLVMLNLLSSSACTIVNTGIPNDSNSHLLFPETLPIMTGAPENNNFYSAAGLRFNWATGCCSFYQILISNSPLIIVNKNISNANTISAIWNSQMNGDINSGYLTPDQFVLYQNGTITSTPFVFITGAYYWSVSGFNNIGELTHSSEEKLFYVQ